MNIQYLISKLGLTVSVTLVILLSIFSLSAKSATEDIILAGGCFWCVESDYESVPGVVDAVSGFTGGHTNTDVTYANVTAGGTGHREVVKITFDPEIVSAEKIINIFWRSVDPTDPGGQFCDRGESYSTAIYATNKTQQKIAIQTKDEINASGKLPNPIITPIQVAGEFYAAEEYHQDYYKKHPIRYRFYRYTCGRDAKVEKLWGDEAHTGITKHN